MTQAIDLEGTWQLAYGPDGDGAIDQFSGSAAGNVDWLEARVPGEVHLDLERAGIIEDPFYGLNHRKLRELEKNEWWLRRTFEVADDARWDGAELVFEGLDTFATMWLNGAVVGRSANSFVAWRFDVTDALKRGENELVVRIASATERVNRDDFAQYPTAHKALERLAVRKAQMSYGWDIAPRLVNAGIWRPVRLELHNRGRITGVYVATVSAGKENARLHLEAEIEAFGPYEGLEVAVHFHCRLSNIARRFRMTGPKVAFDVDVWRPELWWPHTMGEANLYNLECTLIDGDQVIDRYEETFGIRQVDLVQEPTGDGTSFCFKINGRSHFMRGLNWTPADAIFARGDGQRALKAVDVAHELGVDMLRVWGGGVYEDDRFFARCDQLGVLVWQDFMFTAAIYPTEDDFLQAVADEARKVVRRLRNFPSLALWSGDNEVDWWSAELSAHHGAMWRGRAHYESPITRKVLKDVCAELDPFRPYIPSSPFCNAPDKNPNAPEEGDTHNWHHGTSFRDDCYLKDTSNFVSEIGHLSAPSVATIEAFIPPEYRWPSDNPYWDEHFGDHDDLEVDLDRRNRLDDAIVAWFGRLPDNLGDYVRASQIVHGEAVRTFIEYYRLRGARGGKPCGGILVWNLLDNWPQFSDAIVDYFFRRKLACKYLKKAYRPIIVSVQGSGIGSGDVVALNESQKPASAAYTIRFADADGRTTQESCGECTLEPGANTVLHHIASFEDAIARAGGKLVINCALTADDAVISSDVVRFGKVELADYPDDPTQGIF